MRWKRKEKERGWYRYFAWWPIEFSNGEVVWWEWIERRDGALDIDSYEYRDSLGNYVYGGVEAG